MAKLTHKQLIENIREGLNKTEDQVKIQTQKRVRGPT
jgi:hypothetical protein